MTDHPDLIALRAAVLAAPDDDVPRLALADWLEENAGEEDCPDCPGTGEAENGCPRCGGFGRVPNHSDARAEFIRVQCEIARLEAFVAGWAAVPGRAEDGGRAGAALADAQALRKREAELLKDHGEQWAKDALGDHYRPFLHGGGRVEFRRGFVAHVTCPLAAWLGELCENCGGDGEFTRQNSDGPPGPCPDCGGKWNSGPHCDTDSYWDRGTGYVGGVAAAVCGSQPVERVTLSDKEPHETRSESPDYPGWMWCRNFDGARVTDPWGLPGVLYNPMVGQIHEHAAGYSSPSGRASKFYPTRQAALDALSAAALAVGREWAKLLKGAP